MKNPMNQDNAETIRVFLVDDHRSVLWGLEKLIESAMPEMCVVGKATRWTEATDAIKELKPDVILLDLDLGDESGMDAITHFTAMSNARVLILTGVKDQSRHDSAVVLGARGILEKEDAAEVILAAISKVHRGELWLPRLAIDRILADLSKKDIPPKPTPEQKKIASLTPRERAIVAAIANNAKANARMIAGMLFISEHTLRNHLTSIYEKLDVSSRLELYAFAHAHGLTNVESK